jgi:hypothetical protein
MRPEWLPNWRDPSEYPDPDKTEAHQWAWEFLRRNPKYQEAYAHFSRVANIRTDINGRKYVENSEETANAISYIRKNFGIKSNICTPQNPATNKSYDFMFSDFEGPECVIYDDWHKSNGQEQPGLAPRRQGEIVVRFDPDKPLDFQISGVKFILEQAWKRSKPPRARRKYVDYLRILDADSCGESNADIANELYPSNSRKKNMLDDDRRAAKSLRDRDYRMLLRLTKPPK